MQPPDIRYVLVSEGDAFELNQSLTIGRHLDNDLVCAGEDVLDYHLRIEPTSRGPKVYPLGEASLTVNGQICSRALGLAAGDLLQVGQSEISVTVTREHPAEADEWWLYSDGRHGSHRVDGTLVVGRGDASDVQLLDDHISRQHARLRAQAGAVWLTDLGSSNGTCVNGERLVGSCRLYHGDSITFDTVAFQLIGVGADLTPVREQEVLPEQARIRKAPPRAPMDTTEMVAWRQDAIDDVEVPPSTETGAFLLGTSEPVSGLTFRTPMGRTTIGRSDEADVVIRDPSISQRHAEIVVRPEGCTITNLMATNGTRVNGVEVQSAALRDGDVLRLGRVSLVYKDVPTSINNRKLLRQAQWWLLGACAVLAGTLVALLFV